MTDLTQRRGAVRWLTCLVVLVASAGCVSLSRGAPAPQHYVLSGGPSMGATAPAEDSASPAIGLRRPQIPSYLTAPHIVVRQGVHEIGFSEFHRWGEQLGDGINRALAGHLAAEGSFRTINVAPWTPRAVHDYVIQLSVLHFEGVVPDPGAPLEGEAHLLIMWEIIRPGDGILVARGATEHRERGWRVEDFGNLVTLLDAGLGLLAGDLAAAIGALPLSTP